MSLEITDEMVERFHLNYDPANPEETPDVRAGLAGVLAMPEVRQAIHDDVRRDGRLAAILAPGITGYSLGWDQ